MPTIEVPSVHAIRETVPLERIRVPMIEKKLLNGTVVEVPREMWGFVWMHNLPFCFRVWPSTMGTRWGFRHVPENPLYFVTPIATEPITEEDKKYMLEGLQTPSISGDIAKLFGLISRIRGVNPLAKIDEQFKIELEKRKIEYQRFFEIYWESQEMRSTYGNAVSLACNEKEARLHFPS